MGMKSRAHIVFLMFAALLVSARAMAGPSVLVDVKTGAMLHAEQAFDRWSPASLTKLMTAYVTFKAVESGQLTLTAPVRMSANAASVPPSKMGYGIGAVMTVENALEMLIIKSANDVAVALSEAVAGTEAEFVARMNETARALGLNDTNFANPHGLSDPAQYSTARDFAFLSRQIRLEFPQYDPLFAAEAIRTGDTVTASYNLLLGRYAGADGMKTGFVCASGFNIVASATRNGNTLIAVIMGAQSQKERAEKAVELFEKGFAQIASATSAPIITNAPRPANANNVTANLRSLVCTQEAQESRWDGRQIEGFITFNTPEIKPLTREPRAISTGLGGADGQSAAAIIINGVSVKSYPIPSAKPVREPATDLGDMDQFRLRPGLSVPLPEQRPS